MTKSTRIDKKPSASKLAGTENKFQRKNTYVLKNTNYLETIFLNEFKTNLQCAGCVSDYVSSACWVYETNVPQKHLWQTLVESGYGSEESIYTIHWAIV